MAELGEIDWGALAAYLRQMNLVSILCRFVLAAVCGSVIGFERGKKRHAAGLRTHIVVCIGAMSAMLVNQYIVTYFNPNSDPARMGAQVISGIGFLGAGTIIVTRRNQVKGLTTAATLWVTACMGLAVGVGFYACALIMYLILIFILLLVNVVDTKYLKIPTNTAIYIEVKREAGLGDVIHFIHEIGWSVRDVKEFPAGRPEILAVRMDLESDQAMRGDLDTLHLLNEQPSVLRLEVRPVH